MISKFLAKLRWPLLGASAAALAIVTTTALAGSGVGGVFNLGETNTVDATTVLTGNAGNNPQLRVVGSGTAAVLKVEAQSAVAINGVSVSGTGQQGVSQGGIGLLGTHTNTTGVNPGVQGTTNSTDPAGAGVIGRNTGGGPGLKAIVEPGAPPLYVNTETKVQNLNADKLDSLDSSGFWKLGGNAATTPGTNFVGTSDNRAVELKVNGQRALRLEPTAGSPNVIGGFSGNTVSAGMQGATVGGGGQPTDVNVVSDDFGTVGGGDGNTAGDPVTTNLERHATVAGGFGNQARAIMSAVGGGRNNEANDNSSVVGGGAFNVAEGFRSTVAGGEDGVASGDHSIVGGGEDNTASGNHSTIGGGSDNIASGLHATVPGGEFNQAAGNFSLAAGTRAKANHAGTFAWADSTAANFFSTADNQFLVRAAGGAKIVRGGSAFLDATTKKPALLAQNSGTTGEAAVLYQASSSNGFTVLTVLKDTAGTGNYLTCQNISSGNLSSAKCHIDKDGAFVAGSDFAESLPASGGKDRYEPGDVLSISRADPGAVVKSRRARDRAVIGVYSTRPGFIGADKGGITRIGEEEIPVAITGIVPVKVTAENGPIRPGDLLTSSRVPGRAMNAGLNPAVGTVLGKSLGVLQRGQGVIKMLVMPR